MKESKRLFKKKIKEAAEHRLPPSSPRIGKDRFVTNPDGNVKYPLWGPNESGYPPAYLPTESGYEVYTPREHLERHMQALPGAITSEIIAQENTSEGSFITLRIPDISPLGHRGWRDIRLTFEQYRRILSEVPVTQDQYLHIGEPGLGFVIPPWYVRLWRWIRNLPW